jgi:8-oxo-dGTP pyrophosphatase MutT (NUDIX family)
LFAFNYFPLKCKEYDTIRKWKNLHLGAVRVDAVFKTDQAVFNFRVAGILIENDHLLLHKDVNDEHWSLPGGRVQLMEESRESLKREYSEELGVTISVDKMLFTAENFFTYRGANFHEIGFYYLVTTGNGSGLFNENSFYGKEGERLIYRWVPIVDLEKEEIRPQFIRNELKKIPLTSQHFVVK